jgi:hypothetical protein
MHMNELIDSSNVCDECMHAMRGIQLRAAVGMHAMRGKQLRAAVDMRARGGWQRRMCACDIDRGEVVVEKVLPSLAGCHARAIIACAMFYFLRSARCARSDSETGCAVRYSITAGWLMPSLKSRVTS